MHLGIRISLPVIVRHPTPREKESYCFVTTHPFFIVGKFVLSFSDKTAFVLPKCTSPGTYWE